MDTSGVRVDATARPPAATRRGHFWQFLASFQNVKFSVGVSLFAPPPSPRTWGPRGPGAPRGPLGLPRAPWGHQGALGGPPKGGFPSSPTLGCCGLLEGACEGSLHS